ncbi:MAG: acyl-[ACP]--phospholipid O-acyltransferase, partial [Sulfurimonas sp.]
TETAPVISVNMPDALDLDSMRVVKGNKAGTVGRAIPGTMVKIIDPDTLEALPVGEDGLIVVGGPQVMQGYWGDDAATSEVMVMLDGIRYYKTGDKGHVDSDGFISIVDRYSRFAKIGGEMISLGGVEAQLERLFDESIELIAVALNDAKKGEKIVLLYSGDLMPDAMQSTVKHSDMIPLLHPSQFLQVTTLPKLASGKSDFKAAKRLARELSDADG